MKTTLIALLLAALLAIAAADKRSEKRVVDHYEDEHEETEDGAEEQPIGDDEASAGGGTTTGGDKFGDAWAGYPTSGLNSLSALRKFSTSGGLDKFVSRPTFLSRTDQANARFMMSTLGDPQCRAPGRRGNVDKYCALDNPCSCVWGNSKLTTKHKEASINMGGGNVIRVRGLGPWVELVSTVLNQIKTDLPELAQKLRTAGSLCCRKIKRSNGTLSPNYSNHSWGTAIDLYFGGDAERSIQKGIAIVARYFLNNGAYWLFSNDGMHFEASVSTIQSWKRAGKI